MSGLMWIFSLVIMILLMGIIITSVKNNYSKLLPNFKVGIGQYKIDDIYIASLLVIFLITMAGVMIGTETTHKEIIVRDIEVEIVKNSRAVIIDDGEYFTEITDTSVYDKIDSNTNFYYIKYINHFGYEINKELEWDN